MGLKEIPDIENSQNKIPIFNVTDSKFGATPDDQTDDTAAIQSAIDAAGEAGGGIVFLPKGRYEIHKTPDHGFLQIRHNNIVVRGDVENGLDGSKILKSTLHLGSPGKADRIYRLGTVPAEDE
ncbi:MAG: virulence factor, partial [Desulfamplus sp.]|nr:virulence factor [Desulfamplus sp.]